MTPGDYSDTYDPETDFDRYYTIATARRIADSIEPGARVLELGSATGLMSSLLIEHGNVVELLGLDRSLPYLERARERALPGAAFVEADLDNLPDTGAPFDHIVATSVLHELRDPLAFLRECGARLRPGGLIHVTLQNPASIHRLCALELGMIDSLTEVSARGEQWGTTRLWTADDLASLGEKAGLVVRAREGVMLKPLPNGLMTQLPEQVLEGLIRAARYLPEHCAMTYLELGVDPDADTGFDSADPRTSHE